VRVVTGHDAVPVYDERPLVAWGSRVYTQRQWIDEGIVAASILQRASAPMIAASPRALATLDALLPPLDDGVPNRQHAAVLAALRSHLTVICGGPGTGKTHTVARLLAVLGVDAAHRGGSLRIGLAAPTGKAAARLRDALATAARSMPTGNPDAATIALAELPAVTIQRLLGPRPDSSTRFVHHAGRRLGHDVVVIDEASMVSLPLMARLLEAVRDDARLILVGDPDQLASIEVGSVLADIVRRAADPGSPLAVNVVRLDRPRRQASGSPIAVLAEAVRTNQPQRALALLRGSASANAGGETFELRFVEHDQPPAALTAVRNELDPTLAIALDSARDGDASAALAALAQVRVLCAHRRGPFGVQQWNHSIESWMLGTRPLHRQYAGRAVLITRNDPRTGLANGDTGVVVQDGSALRVAFAIGAETRLFTPAQLDAEDTAFALTIHRSQGSEYDTVVVILPPASSALAGRELLYTAVTRATRRLVVVGSAAAVEACITHPGQRISGLYAALGGPPDDNRTDSER
jgi:exodeoxyribonuclease V alpha subunit